MSIDIRMPKLSDSMETGTIVRWLKETGQQVRVGDPLAEVETDKADVEVEAESGGILVEIVVPEGAGAKVGAVIAILSDGVESKGEETGSRAVATDADAAPQEAVSHADAASPRADAVSTDERREGSARPIPGPRRNEPNRSSSVRASPLAWRQAEAAGINLATLDGSGPGGRILKRDVDGAVQGRGAPRGGSGAPPTAAVVADTNAVGVDTPPPVSRMRLTIARRMTEAKRDVPHFYVKASVDMTACMQLREAIKRRGAIPGLTVTHLIVKATALALKGHPRVNASWHGDGSIEFHEEVNIGIAVAVEDGLVVPVVHGTQRLTLAEIALQARKLTDRARSGKFSGKDLADSTISISNVGMLDVDELVAVINPPHAAVLAVAAVKDRPVVRDGQLCVAKTMYATLSCDHRVLNGVEGAEFLQDLKRVLEEPVALLLE